MVALQEQWKAYLNHCFYKDHQSKYLDQTKASLSENECIIQVDFSENYQTNYQDEIQLAHTTYKQVNIFTCCAWFRESVKSYDLVFDYLQHEKYTVFTFLQALIT